jgi:hypothetical protein
MPRLIHLNGPSGVGKSTVARMYADRHPGVLDLDADQIVSLIGGWQDDFWQALHAGRALAISMAETHLRGGHDVVMPQLVTRRSDGGVPTSSWNRAENALRDIAAACASSATVRRCCGWLWITVSAAPIRWSASALSQPGDSAGCSASTARSTCTASTWVSCLRTAGRAAERHAGRMALTGNGPPVY